jgi:hypothetical protein
MDEKTQKEQFQQWLPLYVNGRLNDINCSWMDHYLAEHPKAAAELQIEQALKESLHAELPEFAPELGLDTFMSRIHSEPIVIKESTVYDFCKQKLHRCLDAISPAFLNPRWAMAITLLLVQTGVIGLLLSHRTAPVFSNQVLWRSVGQQSPYQGPVLQITFKSSATEEEIRLLMVKIRGSFLGGPGQLGNYLVIVPMSSIEVAQKQVMNSTIIESVQLLKELPLER